MTIYELRFTNYDLRFLNYDLVAKEDVHLAKGGIIAILLERLVLLRWLEWAVVVFWGALVGFWGIFVGSGGTIQEVESF